MAFSFDKFVTGLASGLATNKGPIGSFGQGFMGSYNAIQNKQNEDLEKEAVGKIMSGDESGWQDWGKVNPQAAMDAYGKQQLLNQKNLEKQFNTTNEIKNYEYYNSLDPEQQEVFNSFRKLPEDTYTKEKRKQQAQAEIKAEQAVKASAGRLNRINSLIESVNKNKELLTPYSSVSSALGAATSGEFGMTNEERTIRGDLVRDIAAIKQELIARAKELGQSGINTATEIAQATAGIDSGDWATLLGALNALKRAEEQVSALENGVEITPNAKQEVISFEDWMNQGS